MLSLSAYGVSNFHCELKRLRTPDSSRNVRFRRSKCLKFNLSFFFLPRFLFEHGLSTNDVTYFKNGIAPFHDIDLYKLLLLQRYGVTSLTKIRLWLNTWCENLNHVSLTHSGWRKYHEQPFFHSNMPTKICRPKWLPSKINRREISWDSLCVIQIAFTRHFFSLSWFKPLRCKCSLHTLFSKF